MKIKTKNKNLRAFSLAEILIAFMLVGIIAVASVPFMKKKTKIVEKAGSHGLYACTNFGDGEYYYYGENKQSAIPTDPSKWAKGNCSDNFNANVGGSLLTVKVVGGGGAGGNPNVSWSGDANDQVFTETGTFTATMAGYYEVEAYGDVGVSPSIGTWVYDNPQGGKYNCYPSGETPVGDTGVFKGIFYLSRNGTLTVIFNEGDEVDLQDHNVNCSSEVRPSTIVGRNGQDITIKRGTSTAVTIQGSKAGIYSCNTDDLCGQHYNTVRGDDGVATIHNYSGLSDYSTSVEPPSTKSGSVVVRWSVDKNSSQKTFSATGGCGGSPGEITSTLYPMLRNKLPGISVGKGGTPTSAATDTVFGSLRGAAGVNNAFCDSSLSDKNDGSAGLPFDAIENLTTYGGDGGVSVQNENINGQSAVGFAAGGGGGAIYYSSTPTWMNGKTLEQNMEPVVNGVTRWYEGAGGNGGPGLVVVSW